MSTPRHRNPAAPNRTPLLIGAAAFGVLLYGASIASVIALHVNPLWTIAGLVVAVAAVAGLLYLARRFEKPQPNSITALADAVRERPALRPPLRLVSQHNDVTELLPIIDGNVHASAELHLRAVGDAS